MKDYVRKRDMGCRVTGSPASKRQRGYNFTALEVCYIFPLAENNVVRTVYFVLKHFIPSVFQFRIAFPYNQTSDLYRDMNLDPNKNPEKEELDHPQNAIILRADIHKYFDAYQFGFDVSLFRCFVLALTNSRSIS